jgi:predicted HicB family RNase H-like nuclease
MRRKRNLHVAARYPKYVEWSDEDQCFIGRCPDLFDGGVHGPDEAGVYRKLLRIVDEWLTILEEDGVPFPKASRSSDFSGKFVVRVPPHVHQRLALKAKASGESLNTFVTKTLRRA